MSPPVKYVPRSFVPQRQHQRCNKSLIVSLPLSSSALSAEQLHGCCSISSLIAALFLPQPDYHACDNNVPVYAGVQSRGTLSEACDVTGAGL